MNKSEIFQIMQAASDDTDEGAMELMRGIRSSSGPGGNRHDER